MMTEAEAKTKWCPFARVWEQHADGASAATNRHAGRSESGPGSNTLGFLRGNAFCIGAACMSWRWLEPYAPMRQQPLSSIDGQGYCGLAGKP